jgi:DNA-binding response OmpR family regulator
MKILVVDDDQRIRDLLRVWLERDGYRVIEADDGQKAMVLMAKEYPDVIVCDLIMPIQEGIEIITRVRDEFPQTCIIAVSGGGKIGPESYLDVAEHLGAWKVYQKPLDMKAMLADLKIWQQRE